MKRCIKMQQMIKRSPLSLLGLIGLALFAQPAAAQVAGSGTSDPSSFDEVVNLPGDLGFLDFLTGFFQDFGGGGTPTQINVAFGGQLNDGFNAQSGTEVNISGGEVGNHFTAESGSEVNVSGGTIGDFFDAMSGSEINIIGGDFGRQFLARSGSVVTILAGTFGEQFLAESGSAVEFSGGTIGDYGNAAGTLNISGGFARDFFDARSGSVVNISDGAVGNSFTALSGSEVNISDDGIVGRNFNANAGSEVNISGGRVDPGFNANAGSVVNVGGGSVNTIAAFGEVNINGGFVTTLNVEAGGQVNISGGTASFVRSSAGSVLDINGGEVRSVNAEAGSVVNFNDGIISGTFDARPNSVVNLFGSNFAIDGIPVDCMEVGETVTISDRDAILTGLLPDGSEFSFELNPDEEFFNADFFSPNATLTVTQAVPQVPFVLQPVILTPITLFNFDGDDSEEDDFGDALSGAGDVNGDGFDDVIVGAPSADNNGQGSGRAQVFSGSDGSVLYTFEGDSAFDRLGFSVSGAGDVNGDGFDDFIVGAPFADTNGSSSGSVRVFSGADGSVLYNFDGDSAEDRFGFSVSGAGDVNGDGFADFVVGTLGDNSNGGGGSARVFSGSNGSVLYVFTGDLLGDRFGETVSDAGDVNGDGFDDIIVSAPGAQNNGTRSGSARVFSGADGSILYSFDGNAPNDDFGHSLSGAGDVNGDGFDDVIVGASGAFTGGTISAQVFSGADGSVLHDLGLDDFGLGFTSFDFNISVSGTGDANGDGFDDFIVGAEGVSGGAYLFTSTTARVFSGANGSVLYQFDENGIDGFGTTVSGAGDVNGDGLGDFIVSADMFRDINFVRVFASKILDPLPILGDADLDGTVTFADIPAFIEVLTSGIFLEEADCNADCEVNFDDIPAFIEILTGA